MHGIIIGGGAQWFKHATVRGGACYTARGEQRCCCGRFLLDWEPAKGGEE